MFNAECIPPRRPTRKLGGGNVIDVQWSTLILQRLLRGHTVLGRVRGGVYAAKGSIVKKSEPIRDDYGLPIEFWMPILEVEEAKQLRGLLEWMPIPGRSEPSIVGKRRTMRKRLLSAFLSCARYGGDLISRSRKSTTRNDIFSCAASARGHCCPKGVAVESYRVGEEVQRLCLAKVGHLRVVET